MQIEVIGIDAAAQLAICEEGRTRGLLYSESMSAIAPLRNITTNSNLTLECHNTTEQSCKKERNVELF